MGCKSSKEVIDANSFLSRFNEDEQYHVRSVFCAIANCPEEKLISKYFVLQEFLDFVGSNLSDLLAHQLFHGMHDIYKGVTFFGFTKYLSFVFEGTQDEQGKVFSYLLSQGKNSITKEELVAVGPEYMYRPSKSTSFITARSKPQVTYLALCKRGLL